MTARRGARAPATQERAGGPPGADLVSVAKNESDGPLSVVWGAMMERDFQQMVVDGLKQRGYLVWTVPDMTRTLAGLPDLIFVHPTRVPRRVYFWELKTAHGRVKPAQKAALAALGDVYGVDARVLRPADWPAALEEV